MGGANKHIRSILIISGVVLIGVLWLLFFRGLTPGDEMDAFCLLLVATVLIVILLINLGRGAISLQRDTDDSPDRFGRSF